MAHVVMAFMVNSLNGAWPTPNYLGTDPVGHSSFVFLGDTGVFVREFRTDDGRDRFLAQQTPEFVAALHLHSRHQFEFSGPSAEE